MSSPSCLRFGSFRVHSGPTAPGALSIESAHELFNPCQAAHLFALRPPVHFRSKVHQCWWTLVCHSSFGPLRCRDDGQSASVVAAYRESWRKAVDSVALTQSPERLSKEWVHQPLIGTSDYPIRISAILMSDKPTLEDFERVFSCNIVQGRDRISGARWCVHFRSKVLESLCDCACHVGGPALCHPAIPHCCTCCCSSTRSS